MFAKNGCSVEVGLLPQVTEAHGKPNFFIQTSFQSFLPICILLHEFENFAGFLCIVFFIILLGVLHTFAYLCMSLHTLKKNFLLQVI